MHETPYVREPGYAQRYRDQRFHRGSGPATHRREAAAVAALLASVAPGTGPWLDVPCGAGRWSDALPQPVVQVDRDRAMLAACPRQPARARACASALHLPFGDATFAGVLCLRLLHHLRAPSERVRVLQELARVSRGPVLLSYFEARTLQHWRRRLRRKLGRRSSGRVALPWQQLCADLAAAGLRPLARRPLVRFVSEQTLVLAAPSSPPSERSPPADSWP